MNTRKKAPLFLFGGIATLFVIIIAGISIMGGSGGKSNKTLDELVTDLPCDVKDSKLEKASVSMANNSLYDELPDIEKYPYVVKGNGDIDLEIFSSPEKAEGGSDGWLIETAETFNKEKHVTSDNQTISISIRDITSGLAADYIISGKHVPELYTPSNALWGYYAASQNADMDIITESLVKNTAGILVKKNSGYTTFDDIYKAVTSGNINMGYTNPQVSSAGMNLLLEVIKNYGEEGFSKFQSSIPYVAYSTTQLKSSVKTGTLDAMVSEYQIYMNDKELQKSYDYIPYGIRHDNPLYACQYDKMSASTKEAIDVFLKYATAKEAQLLATKYGFNADNDYKSTYEASGSDIVDALDVYKSEKDAGKDIVAVFVADCSGSMDGDAILQLKQSLENGMSYINENAYVGLVSYSSNVQIDVPIGKFDLNQKSYFQNAINNLTANGGTSTYEAVCVGLQMIEKEKETRPNAKYMLFVLSDGYANGKYALNEIEDAVRTTETPIYTIAYTDAADKDTLLKLSNINEAAAISADSDDVVYKIKSLFNASL